MSIIHSIVDATADSIGAAIELPPVPVDLTLFLDGTGSSGLIRIELSPDGGSTWIAFDGYGSDANNIWPGPNGNRSKLAATHVRVRNDFYSSGTVNVWLGVS